MKGYASSTIVENRPGAGGRVVMDVVKNSPADGSVMVLTPAVTMCLYPHVYKSLSYNPLQDFAPVTTACTTAMVFAVGPMVPATVKTLAEFIAWCKANPKQASYGSPGAGSPLHFLGVMLSRAANFEYLHVPFQGTAPSIQSLLGGQIASCISPIGPFVQHIKAGTLRALATTGAQRSPLLADVPTIAEAGYPSLQFAEWFGFFVPSKTPGETVERLSSVLRAAMQTKEVQAGLANQSVEPGGLTPAEFARQIKADYERWGPIVKEFRIHAGGLAGTLYRLHIASEHRRGGFRLRARPPYGRAVALSARAGLVQRAPSPRPAKRGEGAPSESEGGRGAACRQFSPSPGSRFALATLSR